MRTSSGSRRPAPGCSSAPSGPAPCSERSLAGCRGAIRAEARCRRRARLLAFASFAFAAAEGPWALGLARLVQGASSTITWAGAFAWLTVAAPRDRRGELIGTAFGAAVFGAILGPMFGAVADAVSVRISFAAVGGIAALLAAAAATRPTSPPQTHTAGAVSRAFADRSFLGGLWLNTLPAILFGVLVVLVPLQLDEGGFTPFAIGAVFLSNTYSYAAATPRPAWKAARSNHREKERVVDHRRHTLPIPAHRVDIREDRAAP